MTVNSVALDATKKVLAQNEFNDDPAEGNQYAVVNLTATYVGEDQDGRTPFVSVEYVTSGGNTVNSYDTFAVVEDRFDSLGTLYPGASTTGSVVFEIPTKSASKGTTAVGVELFSDTVFCAVK